MELQPLHQSSEHLVETTIHHSKDAELHTVTNQPSTTEKAQNRPQPRHGAGGNSTAGDSPSFSTPQPACLSLRSIWRLFCGLLPGITWRVRMGMGTREVLYDRDRHEVKRKSVAVHLVINILSTTLLSASNYCMVRYPLFLKLVGIV